MSARRNRVNIYVPAETSFAALNLNLPSLNHKANVAASNADALAQANAQTKAAALAAAEELPDDHFLYVIDSKGRMLERMRFQGDDYRGALRSAFASSSAHDQADPKC